MIRSILTVRRVDDIDPIQFLHLLVKSERDGSSEIKVTMLR